MPRQKINKIQKMSAPDLVCEEIKAMIAQHIWTEGDKLPSENELAEAYGVNRFTIRMALQKLSTLGILETHVGDGTYVHSFDFSAHMKEIFEFYMSDDLLDDVGEFREIIETACIRLALKRATNEELNNLKDLCENFEKIATNFLKAPLGSQSRKFAFDRLNDTDIELHSLICRMAHNDLLFYSFSTAREAIREHMSTIGYRRLMPLTRAEDLQSLKEHWQIYDILCKKPADSEELLAALIKNHVRR